MDAIKKIGTDIKDGWRRLDEAKKKRLILLVILAVLVISGLTYFTQRKNYTVLFSNLDEADAGSIVENLEAEGMSYQLEENGSTILIEDSQIDRYRINLAMDGLMPRSSTGFELFDEAGMMTTDDDRAIMYQRAVQAELENSIRSLSQINDAQVLLNLPEESIFQNPEYQTQSSASVRLDTSGTLSQQSIQGIASLVAGAVENLPIQNINIVDEQGTLLSGFLQNGENGQVDLSSNNQSIRRAFEEDMEQRIINLLGTNARVSVYANMDFEAVEGERVTYENPLSEENTEGDPEQERRGLLRSETISGRGANDYSSLIDVENQPEFDDEEGENNNQSIDTTRNYELNQETERYARAPGEINPSAGDITASIIVDQSAGFSNDDVREIAARAMGIDVNTAELANIISINQMNLSAEEDTPISPGKDLLQEIMNGLRNSWPYLLAFVALIVIGLIILSIMRKREDEDEIEEIDMKPNETTGIQLDTPAPLSEAELEAERKKAKKDQKNKVLDEKEEKAKATAKENPELAAELMKLWLNDRNNK